MGTIIKDLIILNEDNFYLTKQDKTIKNEYNVIGKSYNKKEKYKTQETNYEMSLEYIINKTDKLYFFNLLNNNNYFLYKRKENFNCDLIYESNITAIYIDVNNKILNNINIFNYDINNRLYLLIDNKKYSFYFDESYDYNIDNKYRLIDEISLNSSSNLTNVKAEILDLCILINNNIKFKFLTDEKYSLTFDIETINNIIQKKEIINNTNQNLINTEEFKYKQELLVNKLYTKLIKINENHFFLIETYLAFKENIMSINQEIYKNFYIKCKFHKVYFNNAEYKIIDTFIEDFDFYFDKNNFNLFYPQNLDKVYYFDHLAKSSYRPDIFNDDIYSDRYTYFAGFLLKFINFNTYIKDNILYFSMTSAEKNNMNVAKEIYNFEKQIVEKTIEQKNNIVLKSQIFHFEFNIINDKNNIIDFKTSNLEDVIEFNQYNLNNDVYKNIDLQTVNYIYNDELYLISSVFNTLLTYKYNKETNNFIVVRKNNEVINNDIYYNLNNKYINYNNINYKNYYKTIIEEQNKDYIEIIYANKNTFKNYIKNENINDYNESNTQYELNKAYNLNLLEDMIIGNNIMKDYSVNIAKSSNNYSFFNTYTRFQQNHAYYKCYCFNLFEYFFKSCIFKNNNTNVFKKINNVVINISKATNDSISYQSIKDINYYYNIVNNKHYLSFRRDNLGYIINISILEFEYDNNETITLTKIKNISTKYSSFFNNFDLIFNQNDIDFVEIIYNDYLNELKYNFIKLDYNLDEINNNEIKTNMLY